MTKDRQVCDVARVEKAAAPEPFDEGGAVFVPADAIVARILGDVDVNARLEFRCEPRTGRKRSITQRERGVRAHQCPKTAIRAPAAAIQIAAILFQSRE